MAKPDPAIERFLAEQPHLRHVAGQWTRWDGRVWRPVTAGELVELFRAHPPPMKRCDPPDEGGSAYTFKDDASATGGGDSPISKLNIERST